METKNWRDVVELKKVFLTGWDEPDAHYYEVFRKQDGLMIAFLDLAKGNTWLADMEDSGSILVNLLTADDVLALYQAMDYLNRLVALEELTQISQDMGLYEAM
jgi:hypothetical protein